MLKQAPATCKLVQRALLRALVAFARMQHAMAVLHSNAPEDTDAKSTLAIFAVEDLASCERRQATVA